MFVNHPFPEEWRRGRGAPGEHRRGLDPAAAGRAERCGCALVRCPPLPAARGDITRIGADDTRHLGESDGVSITATN